MRDNPRARARRRERGSPSFPRPRRPAPLGTQARGQGLEGGLGGGELGGSWGRPGQVVTRGRSWVKGAAMGYHIDTKAPENGEWRAKLSLNSAGMKLLPANYTPRLPTTAATSRGWEWGVGGGWIRWGAPFFQQRRRASSSSSSSFSSSFASTDEARHPSPLNCGQFHVRAFRR